jgi:lipopolysaccharide transport system ATP-binding protein
MSDVAISLHKISKQYKIGRRERYGTLRDTLTGLFKRREPTEEETFWALKDVSFDIAPGEVLGIIGRNGAGKSTLLKVLSRITEPTSGTAELHGRVGSLLEVGTGFHPELTGRENIFLSGTILGMKRAEITARFDEIVAFSEVEKFLDTQVKHYSSGMFMRLAFAVAAYLQPEILLVDEVLAVGDASFQEKCLGKMQDISTSGRTVVFVSHNMESVRKLCTKAVHLKGGQVQAIGPSDEIIGEYLTNFHADRSTSTLTFDAKSHGFIISRVEVLDLDGNPKLVVSTWDPVRFRIHFECPRAIKSGGGVVLIIQTLTGVALNFFANEPDQTQKIELKEGHNEVDLIVPQIMLAGGKYLVSASLGITNVEWMVRSQEVVFEVEPRDVFNSGMAPRTNRHYLVQDYRWEVR